MQAGSRCEVIEIVKRHGSTERLFRAARAERCNRQNGAARIGRHGTGRWVTEACHVPLDRRGTPRTCYAVADQFGFGNWQTVAPPALGDKQEGNAAAPGGTVATRSSQAFRRQSAKAAAAEAETKEAAATRWRLPTSLEE
jgi:hypothetical protein